MHFETQSGPVAKNARQIAIEFNSLREIESQIVYLSDTLEFTTPYFITVSL